MIPLSHNPLICPEKEMYLSLDETTVPNDKYVKWLEYENQRLKEGLEWVERQTFSYTNIHTVIAAVLRAGL